MSTDASKPAPPEVERREARLAKLTPKQRALLEKRRSGAGPASPSPPALPDVAPFDLFPLTDVQQAYWIGRDPTLPLGGSAAFGYGEFDVDDIEPYRLEDAWNRLIKRHPALRTVLTSDGAQKFLPTTPRYQIPIEDLRTMSMEDSTNRLFEKRQQHSHRLLDATKWPLFDVQISQIGDSRIRVHVGIDTLIADARSFHILTHELDMLLADPETDLPPLGVTFKEYVSARRANATPENRNAAQTYWYEQLEQMPPSPALARAAAAPEGSVRFSRLQGNLSATEWERLRTLAGERRITPSNVLLTAFAEVLAHWSNSAKFTINLTIFNRRPVHPDVERVVGCFTDLSLLAVDMQDAPTFEGRARALQARLWKNLEHRDVSGLELMREAARRGGTQRLMPVVFTSALESGASSHSRLGAPVFAISQTPQVSIDFQVVPASEGIAFCWDVAEELFPADMPRQMFEAFRDVITNLIHDKFAWNLSAIIGPRTAMSATRDKLEAVRDAVPWRLLPELVNLAELDRIAIAGPSSAMTYGELDACADAIAAALQADGVSRSDLIGISMERGPLQICAVLGVLRSGAAFMPLGPQLPPSRAHDLAHRAGLKVILADETLDEASVPANTRLVRIADIATSGKRPRAAENSADDLAYVIFTSGSTGTPKGVMISHRSAINTIVDMCDRLQLTRDDVVLALSDLSFDLAVFDIFGTLAAGAKLVCPANAASAKDPAHLAELVDQHGVTLWNSVPALMSAYANYLQSAGRTVASLKVILLSGDWIPLKLPEQIRMIAPRALMFSAGGATEVAIWSVCYPISAVDPSMQSVPYGAPMTNQTARVMNEAGDELPDWVTGELRIGGQGVALGYIGEPGLTAERFVPDPRGNGARHYRTGDNARHFPNGIIELVGRTDAQVKINGYRVDLREIEAEINRHTGVLQARVVAPQMCDGARQLRAYVTADPNCSVDEIRNRLRTRLPAYMVPAKIDRIESFPLTENGKIDLTKIAVSTPLPSDAAPPVVASSMSNRPVVAFIAGIAASILNLDDPPAPDAELLTLGADSLSLLRLRNEILKAIDLEIPAGQILADPRIGAIAEIVERELLSAALAVRAGALPSNSETLETGEI